MCLASAVKSYDTSQIILVVYGQQAAQQHQSDDFKAPLENDKKDFSFQVAFCHVKKPVLLGP